MEIRIESFGKDYKGIPADLITLTNRTGASVSLCNFGAHLVSVKAPDRTGRLGELCLGFDTCAEYGYPGNGYIGATVGRVANRIGGASFTLNGREFRLAANNGRNTLHGGMDGFNRKRWSYETARDGAVGKVIMTYTSMDGEEGFPGELRTEVSFSFGDDHRLVMDYTAVSDADTLVNLTNHAYFNLGDGEDILDHQIRIDAEGVIRVNSELIPTGEILPVEGSLYDLRGLQRIGDLIDRREEHPMLSEAAGFDVSYVLSGEGMRHGAELYDPASGRRLDLYTDQPGVQFYSGQGLSCIGRGGKRYKAYSGLALETQQHPDSIHHPAFGNAVLKAGDRYRATTMLVFGTSPA